MDEIFCEVELHTMHGDYVNTVWIPRMPLLWPEILMWGQRMFVRQCGMEEARNRADPPPYHEGLVVVGLDTETMSAVYRIPLKPDNEE